MRKSLASIAGLLLLAASANAATVGFTESFTSGLGGWGGGSDIYDNPGSGGVGGATDGYLEVGNVGSHQLGARNEGGDYVGNIPADGVTGVTFYLSELGTDDGLEIHVGIGQAFSNFWISNAGFTPPTSGWAQFSIDFSDPGQWTQTIGSGTFADALAGSDHLLFRHDSTPITQPPAFVTGDFGLDEITIVPEPASMLMLILGAGAAAGRRC